MSIKEAIHFTILFILWFSLILFAFYTAFTLHLHCSNYMKENAYITMPDGKKRNIGWVDNEAKTYVKHQEGSKHLFKSIGANGGWGVDEEFFNTQLLPENYKIGVLDTEKRTWYITDATKFKEKAEYRNLGFGKQILLPIEHWEIKKL